MDTKKLKERLVADGEKAFEAQLANTKRRGRKPGRKPSISPTKEKAANEKLKDLGLVDNASEIRNSLDEAKAETLLKSCIKSDNRQNAIRIIEDEIGKDNLIRIAVKYLYNAIGGTNA